MSYLSDIGGGLYNMGTSVVHGMEDFGSTLFGNRDYGNTSQMGALHLADTGTKAAADSGGYNFVSNLMNYGKSGLDFLNAKKDAIGLAGGLAAEYFNYQNNKDAQALAREQMDQNNKYRAMNYADSRAEQQRQINKEVANTNAMQNGFNAGFRKKKSTLTTPYTGLAGYGTTAATGV